MDLHLAIKNILKYQGETFLHDTRMLNALADFQAYDSHPALKNIFRTLHNDGYIDKLAMNKQWDSKCSQLVYEIVRDYAFPSDVVEYILKSVSFGLGAINSVIDIVSDRPKMQPTYAQKLALLQNPTSQNKPWKKLSVDEREIILNSLLEIKQSKCGLKYDSIYIADDSNDQNQVCFYINYEVSGKLPKERWVNLAYAIYDKSNRLRKKSILTSTLGDSKEKSYNIIDSDYVSLNFKYSDIGKILLYIED